MHRFSIRKTINLKLLRDLIGMRWRAISLILIIGAGVGTYSGIEMALGSLFHTKNRLLLEQNFADLEVIILPEDVNNLPDLKNIPGLVRVERRLVFPGEIKLDGRNRLPGRMVLLENMDPAVNRMKLMKGSSLMAAIHSDRNSVVIERSLLREHDFRMGDSLFFQVGKREYRLTVAGVVLSPEYITTSSNPDYFLPGPLGVVFGDLKLLDSALGFTMVNDLIFKFEDGADRALLKDEITRRLSRFNIEQVFTREGHFTNRFFDINVNAFSIYTPAIEIVIELLIFVLVFITFSQLISNQRKEIGNLFCLGYKKSEILCSYLLGGGAISVLGGLFGVPVTLIIRYAFSSIIGGTLGLPAVYQVFYLREFTLALLTGLIVSLSAVGFSLTRILKMSPQEIIRNYSKANSLHFKRFQEMLGRFQAIPIEVLFSLRNTLRRPWITLATLSCIGLALAVSISYLIAMASFRYTVRNGFNQEHWDVAVDFLYPVMLDELSPLSKERDVVKFEPYFRRHVEVGRDGRFEAARMLGIEPRGELRGIILNDRQDFKFESADAVIVSSDLAGKLRLKIGDNLSLKAGPKSGGFTVRGITSEISIGQIIVPFRAAQEIAGFEDEATGAYIKAGGRPEPLRERIGRYDFVGNITDKKRVVSAFFEGADHMSQSVNVAIAISVFVAIIFIFTSANMAVREMQWEYAVLKSLGYGRRQLSKIIFSESLCQVGAACLIAVPLAVLIAVFLNLRMEKAWFRVDNYFRFMEYLKVLLPTLVFLPAVLWPSIRAVHDLDISRAVRARIIE